jgi:hypothetical protein
MAILLMMLTMLAFAAVYALISAMLGEHRRSLVAALVGDRAVQPGTTAAASRCFSRA